MKKQSYLLIGLTSLLFILFLTNSLLDILNLDWSYLLQDIEKIEKIVFLVLVFSLSMTFFFCPLLARDRRNFTQKNAD